MSEPSKSATWTTKLLSKADQTLNAIGIATAIINKRKIGLRQKGNPLTSKIETERYIKKPIIREILTLKRVNKSFEDQCRWIISNRLLAKR